jgi:hypothetical protein
MDSIVNFLKDLAEDREYYFYYDDELKQVWITGRLNGKHFDLVAFPIKRYVKVVFETADRRLPMLFLNENDALKRIQKIFSEQQKEGAEKVEGQNIFGFQGYSIERAKN